MGTTHRGVASEDRRRKVALRFAALGRHLSLATALLLGFLAAPQAALAQNSGQLVKNVGQPGTFYFSGRTYDFAQAFSTGTSATGYRLTSVQVALRVHEGSASVPRFAVELWSDSSGSPGTRLATLTNPTTLRTGRNNVQFDAPVNGIDLDASTTYHVVWNVAAGQGNRRAVGVGFTTKDNEDSGKASGWSIADTANYRNNGMTKWTSFSRSKRIIINGYTRIASEPDLSLSTLGLEYREPSSSPAVWSSLSLSPAFDSGTTDYTANLTRVSGSRGTGSVRFTATTTSGDVGAVTLFHGSTDRGAFNGSNPKPVQFQNGRNVYRIVLSARNSTATRTYRVVLTEALSQGPTVSIERSTSTIEPNKYLNLKAVASDPDGGAVETYRWSVTRGGNDVTSDVLSATDSAEVVFGAATTGSYSVSVRVTDDESDSASAVVTISVAVTPTVVNDPPSVTIAQSGPLYVQAGTALTLDATASDGDGSIASYAWWARSVGDGNQVTGDVLSGTDTASVTFNANAVGEYRVGVQVFDNDGASTGAAPVTVWVTPVAASSDASLSALTVTTGGPQRRRPLILVPPFSPTTYEYSVVEPQLVWRRNAQGQYESHRSTTRPNAVTENYGIITVVNAGHLNVTATVNDADAKLAGSLPWVPRGETETLTELRMTSGVEKGVGPLVQGQENVLTITVTAEDGTMRDYTVRVKRKGTGRTPPTATLAPSGNQTIAAGSDLTLDASASSDPDGGALIGHAWYVMGPRGRNATAAVLGGVRTESQVTFNATSAGTYRVWMMAFDDDGHVGYANLRVTVTPSGPLAFHVADASVAEPSTGTARLYFDVTLSQSTSTPVWVSFATSDGTAVAGEDYRAASGRLRYAPGETWKRVGVTVFNDAHDEGEETFTLRLSNPIGAALGDPVATGTITNTGPMPAAWLARYGRTVAEQALDGISGRLKASRAAGFEGSLGGQALSFGAGSPGGGPVAAGPAADGRALTFGQAQGAAAVARTGTPWEAARDGYEADTGFGDAMGAAQPRTLTAHELLLGSAFTLTGAEDSSGGSMAFWGRGAQSRFDGRENTHDLDGTVTTGMLGADYAQDRWMLGLALMQSKGEGGYADRGSQSGGENMEGEIETSLTAAVPYGAWRASERLDVWVAAGLGSGEMTLDPKGSAAMETDLDWTMAAAGLRSELLASPDSGAGPGLALTADALWASTGSDARSGGDGMSNLVATDSKVTRLRVGLEGSWTVVQEGGGRIVPRLEVGARHDGGDAETGTGVDLGGGIVWSDPGSGLSLEVEGRTLLAHGAGGIEDSGFAASLAFDPGPGTMRGPSFALRQDWGGRAEGGIDALFTSDPLSGRSGAGEAQGRWTAEAAYGFAAFGGGFTASPHIGIGLSETAREYSLGWKVTPEGPAAPDLSFGVKATRHESAEGEADHRIGLELRTHW